VTLYGFATAHMMVVGVLAIWLIASRPHLQRWGFVLGLENQWAWYYVAIHDASWGIVAMNIIYTISYIRGIRLYWRSTWTSPTA
jgi:hypothetical protein